MNIFEILTTIELSDSEDSIRQLILKDPNQFISLSTEAILKNSHTSRATLYRLCEKLDVDGVSGLKVRLGTDFESWNEANKDFNFNFPVKEGVSVQTITTNLEIDYDQTIRNTKNLIDSTAIRNAAKRMDTASSIDVYTSAGNIYFAQNFAFQMKEIGKEVHVPVELYQQTLYAAASNQTHFAIVISFGGRNWQMKKLCRILKENGTPILLICSGQAAPLFPYSDFRLYMSAREDHSKKISSFSTRLSLLYILDVLYTCFFELDYSGNQKRKEEFYQILSSSSETD